MHFCPRCQMSYHASCLTNNDWIEDQSVRPGKLPRDIRFERSLETASAEYAMLPSLNQHLNPSTAKLKLNVTYSSLPRDLLLLARSPIARGGPEHGVAGNIFPVMRARALIYDALMADKSIPKNWREDVSTNLSKVQAWIAEDSKFLCPNCHEVI